MARAARADPEDAPEPDRREGAPHPRMAPRLHGHGAAEAEVLEAVASGRVHSGWLVAGPEGVGKATFAYRMAGTLVACRPGDPAPRALGLPEGHPDLALIRAGAHPRLFVMRRTLTDDGRLATQIRVEDARALGQFLHLSAPDGGARVVIVDPADEMNPNAANAILKLLEEPPARTHLLLLAHQPARLLPTIRSRCRLLRLGPVGPEDLAAALADAGLAGADPVALAELSGGSAGVAMGLAADGGLDLYRDLVDLLGGAPRMDRARMRKLAEGAVSRGRTGGGDRLRLTLDLIDLALARLARAGAAGPSPEAAPGEAAAFARLAPGPAAARAWADCLSTAGARARAGAAVNLDPVSLVLDMLLAIEETARAVAA